MNNRSFFEVKKPWSEIKDRLLQNYIPPYLEKIKKFNRQIFIVDCFAGIGKFDDGTLGSPLIFLEKVSNSNAMETTKLIFIEKDLAEELKSNLPKDTTNNYEVWDGCYEEQIDRLTRLGDGANVFFYIDPYGTKSLNFSFFSKLKNSPYKTVEMLINFNSQGFIREGCRLLKYDISSCLDYDDEEPLFDKANTAEHWDEVANGSYWRELLKQVVERTKSFNQIEEIFIAQYLMELRKIFKYVIDVPIKMKNIQIPKYRMIYATMSHHGVFLMVDEMHKGWKDTLKKESCGQGNLFENEGIEEKVNPFCDFEDFDYSNIETSLSLAISKCERNMRDVVLDTITKKGIAYSISDYIEAFKKLENDKKIRIRRDKAKTNTGKPSKFYDFRKEDIFVEEI